MNQVPVAESKERENDLCDIKYPKNSAIIEIVFL